jgi:hypothetical protein
MQFDLIPDIFQILLVPGEQIVDHFHVTVRLIQKPPDQP